MGANSRTLVVFHKAFRQFTVLSTPSTLYVGHILDFYRELFSRIHPFFFPSFKLLCFFMTGLQALPMRSALRRIWSGSWRMSSSWMNWKSTGRKRTKRAWWVIAFQDWNSRRRWHIVCSELLNCPLSVPALTCCAGFNYVAQVTLQQWPRRSGWLVSYFYLSARVTVWIPDTLRVELLPWCSSVQCLAKG